MYGGKIAWHFFICHLCECRYRSVCYCWCCFYWVCDLYLIYCKKSTGVAWQELNIRWYFMNAMIVNDDGETVKIKQQSKTKQSNKEKQEWDTRQLKIFGFGVASIGDVNFFVDRCISHFFFLLSLLFFSFIFDFCFQSIFFAMY